MTFSDQKLTEIVISAVVTEIVKNFELKLITKKEAFDLWQDLVLKLGEPTRIELKLRRGSTL